MTKFISMYLATSEQTSSPAACLWGRCSLPVIVVIWDPSLVIRLYGACAAAGCLTLELMTSSARETRRESLLSGAHGLGPPHHSCSRFFCCLSAEIILCCFLFLFLFSPVSMSRVPLTSHSFLSAQMWQEQRHQSIWTPTFYWLQTDWAPLTAF